MVKKYLFIYDNIKKFVFKNISNVNLVFFGAPFNTYRLLDQKVLQNAKNFGQFSIVILFLKMIYLIFFEITNYENFLLLTRGYGYWMMKSFLKSRIMDLITDDDLICYAYILLIIIGL